MGKAKGDPDCWRRGPRAAELLAAGEFSDVTVVAGQPPERIPAARVLLAIASEPLAVRLRELGRSDGEPELELPGLSAAAARALVAYSCGVPLPFDACSPDDALAVAALLRTRPARKPGAASARGDPTQHRELSEVPSSHTFGWREGVLVLAALVLLVVSLAAYLPVRSFNMQVGGFFMDDVMIQRNAVVVDQAMDWKRLWRTDYWGLEMFDPNTWTHKSFRPLVVLTFRWNYWLHGFNSAGFHLTNVAMHACASAQLAVFGRTALGLPALWSGLLAALFAAHPVHSESICYVVGRADLVCTQILLLACQIFRRCAGADPCGPVQAWCRLAAAVVLILAAGLCKETGFTFFGMLVIWEVLGILGRSASSSIHPGRDLMWRWVRILALLVVGAAACAGRLWYTSGTQIARMDPYSNPVAASEDPKVRFLSYALVHGMYMKLLVWPFFLCYDYSMDAVPLVQSLGDHRLLLPLAAYLGFLQAVCVALRRTLLSRRSSAERRVAEGALLGIAFFVLSFLPMTNILFPIGTLVAERLLYMPSLGFLACVVCLVHLEARRATAVLRAVFFAALLAVLATWWWLCYSRVDSWQTVESITLADGLRQLRSTRTQFNLANIYMTGQRLDEALVAYQRANSLDPQERDSMPLYHAGQILMYRGQYVEAERYLHKAVSGYFSPLTLHEEEVWHDYGLALWHVGRQLEAVQNFQNAIITNPAFPKAYNNLGCALVMVGLSGQPYQRQQVVQEGLQAMEQAVTMAPVVPLYWRNAAVLLGLAGDRQASSGAWERYRQLDPAGAAAIEASGSMPSDCVWEFYFR